MPLRGPLPAHALVLLACATGALGSPPLFNNGNLSTGPLTSGGVQAPAGTLWSELPTPLSGAEGFSMDSAAGTLLADDFNVAASDVWNVQQFVVYAYQPGASADAPTITGARIRLWQGLPGGGASSVIWDSLLAAATPVVAPAGVWRCDARGLTDRPIFAISVPATLTIAPGHYWLEWSASGRLAAGVWCPPVTSTGQRGLAGANAVQYLSGAWRPVFDGTPADAPPVYAQDFPFLINGYVSGTSAQCYPNCDGSTGAPYLNTIDFSCFLSRFALGSAYANCDGSTTPPVLNVADLMCYVTAFGAGCSAP